MSDLHLSAEQTLLREVAQRYFGSRYAFAERQAIVASPEGHDRERWAEFAEMGWLGMGFPERFGGSEASMADIVLLMRSFGQALVAEPYLASVCLGGRVLLNSGDEGHCQSMLPELIAGRLHLALAYAEPTSGERVYSVETTATPTAAGFQLNGRKTLVLGPTSADWLIVSARTSGGATDRDGVTLFRVRSEAPKVQMRPYATIDGRRAADVWFDDVLIEAADTIGSVGGGVPILEETVTQAALILLGEAQGAIEGALERTIDHLKTREQFGRKLAEFQALRHRVADMVAAKEEAAALIGLAARSFDEGEPDRDQCVAIAKAYMGLEGADVCKEAIQLHGAIAISDEYIVGHYLKRVVCIDRLFGGVDQQIDYFINRFEPLTSDSRAC
jgi:alkylation response protein AidB-like acyl-CoA dehydrogenase